jgi:exodeoxyribonuclease V alpha subunit
MQVESDYDKELYNGDLGFVRAVDPEAGELLVEFDGPRSPTASARLDELVLAYATTIHKSQGSEYPAVVIPLTTQHYPPRLLTPEGSFGHWPVTQHDD